MEENSPKTENLDYFKNNQEHLLEELVLTDLMIQRQVEKMRVEKRLFSHLSIKLTTNILCFYPLKWEKSQFSICCAASAAPALRAHFAEAKRHIKNSLKNAQC